MPPRKKIKTGVIRRRTLRMGKWKQGELDELARLVDQNLAAMRDGGKVLGFAELGARLGRPSQGVQAMIDLMGLDKSWLHKRFWRPEEDARLIELRRDGVPQTEMAMHFIGRSKSSINARLCHLRKAGLL
jgi:hypothetical protein